MNTNMNTIAASDAAEACWDLDQKFPGQGWAQTADAIDPDPLPDFLVNRNRERRPYGAELPTEHHQRRIENATRAFKMDYEARHKDLKKAFAASERRVKNLAVATSETVSKMKDMSKRLRASVNRNDLTGDKATEALAAAAAMEQAIAALKRIG